MKYQVCRQFTPREIIARKDVCVEAVQEIVRELNLDSVYKISTILSEDIIHDLFDRLYGGKNGLNWLIKHNYIAEIDSFEPFELNIKVNTREEALSLWHRFNISDKCLTDEYKTTASYRIPKYVSSWYDVWMYIDNAL